MANIGNNLAAERDNDKVTIYNFGSLLKHVDISDAFERRLLIVELVNDLGAKPSLVAIALKISRQTVYNTLDAYKQLGRQGLLDNKRRGNGNKARIFEEQRKLQNQAKTDSQIAIQFSDELPDYFDDSTDWQKTRYAGGLIFSAILENKWNLIPFFSSAYGKLAKVFILFVQMLVHGIKSIEQLKAVKKKEFGLACGMSGSSPSRETFSLWLHTISALGYARAMIKRFFREQIIAGIVNIYVLFVDGHFLAYSGKEKVHKGYKTQRRLVMPGQTTIYFHDASGRVVYFSLEEGQGDLRQNIVDISKEFQTQFNEDITPLIVSDRETWCMEHFIEMSDYRFVTWEKNTYKKEINELSDDLFSDIVIVNERPYRFYEFPEKKEYQNGDKTLSVALRRIVIWNLESDTRPVCVSNDAIEKDKIFLGQNMLGRWGASENGFKHSGDRFNLNYVPLIKVTEDSENQEMKNPVFKQTTAKKRTIENGLQKVINTLVDVDEVYNKDGSVRSNSKRQRLLRERSELEDELVAVKEQLKVIPERINLKDETDGEKSFKVIDQETKNLFDLVQSMVWNARRTLIDMLRHHYSDKRDLINLLDHISRCHGWVKTTQNAVIVQLEPLDVPRYRAAQKGFINELNSLKACLPNGKVFKFSVGNKKEK